MPEREAQLDTTTSVPALDARADAGWNSGATAAQELAQARIEIERLNARVRELAMELVATREAERARLARELHDGLGAQLTASRYALARIETWLPMNAAEACHEALATANTALDNLCETSHRLVEEGHAPALEGGLVNALTRWIDDFSAATRLQTSFETIADAPSMRARIAQIQNDGANTVFRIVQESLNNTAKHAAAQSVEVTIAAERRFLTLTIKDDGRGLARGARAKANRFGLSGMRARCEALGGSLKISSQAGQGMQVRARLPWDVLCTSR
ncbi:sensor histidine kinase [Pararobbsia alpina]|uniref:Signal transduction histidine-protein kinase/phosphatase DegS n=1 Tax=Pararobbsia alpina TaxID=621374 RepID=A0A6S7AUL8_9BURK|nr:ATP-binding protein [Pararobbsia alpina]CAB3778454.1 Signal transduction histidine-protein kinase/phosphatase DegS [Pararobbsia alpina]